ncbi:MAG: hypothetical protein FWF79_03725 [Defluviitaleaceae bacterium]|nr:hypothetical protein [Defluviitaleaceae bacterium]
MNNNQNQDRITGQIAVHKTDKKLLEFIDNLNPAPLLDYAAIHAGTVRPHKKDGQRVYSVIRIVAQDYSRKGEPSIRVKANIAPEEAIYFAEAVRSGVKDFKFEAVKIFGSPDNQGFSPMTKLWITRSETTPDGEILKRPWKVDIENGKGRKAHGKNGGSYCQSGSYVLEKKVFINFTDYEFFKLLCGVERFITVWEIAHGAKLVKDGRLARDTQYANGDF